MKRIRFTEEEVIQWLKMTKVLLQQPYEDKNIYKVGDRVEVVSCSSRHNGKRGVIERVLYKVRFDDGSDSAFVESSLEKEEQDEIHS